jgi:hypothetical protein
VAQAAPVALERTSRSPPKILRIVTPVTTGLRASRAMPFWRRFRGGRVVWVKEQLEADAGGAT